MLIDRIRSVLEERPYWGPKSVAEAVGTNSHVVRVVASREGIKFMDRYEVEAVTDRLMDQMNKIHGKA